MSNKKVKVVWAIWNVEEDRPYVHVESKCLAIYLTQEDAEEVRNSHDYMHDSPILSFRLK